MTSKFSKSNFQNQIDGESSFGTQNQFQINSQDQTQKQDQDQAKISIFVDYAHEPASMQKLLDTVKKWKDDGYYDFVIHILSCDGAGRDDWKKPIMGEISFFGADFCFFTTDNYTEKDKPEEILEMLAKNISKSSSFDIISDSLNPNSRTKDYYEDNKNQILNYTKAIDGLNPDYKIFCTSKDIASLSDFKTSLDRFFEVKQLQQKNSVPQKNPNSQEADFENETFEKINFEKLILDDEFESTKNLKSDLNLNLKQTAFKPSVDFDARQDSKKFYVSEINRFLAFQKSILLAKKLSKFRAQPKVLIFSTGVGSENGLTQPSGVIKWNEKTAWQEAWNTVKFFG